MRGLLGLALTAVLSTVVIASGVVTLQLAPPGSIVKSATPGAAGAAATVGAQAGKAAQPAGDPKQQRLQKIKQLQFDRRPSAILKAWLEFSKEKKKEAAEKKSDDTPAGEAAEPNAETEKERPAEEAPKKQEEKEKKEAAKDEPRPDAESSEEAGEETAEEDQGDDEAKAKAEADKKKAEEEKAKAEQARVKAEQEKALKEFERQLKTFQRDVTLGRWPEVKEFLAGLQEEEAKAAYARLLDALRAGPAGNQAGGLNPQLLQQMILDAADRTTMQAALSAGGQGPGAAFVEKNQFSMADIAGLVVAAPHALDKECFTRLGTILRQTLAAGHNLDGLLRELHLDKQSGQPRLTKREVARLLCASGQEARAGDFLPALEDACRDADAQALNLLARHYLAKHGKETKATYLEKAWEATQAILATETPPEEEQPPDDQDAQPAAKQPDGDVAEKPEEAEKTPEEKAEEEARKEREELRAAIKAALTRAVELAPRLPKELGQTWLDESFASRTERGREILVALGTQVSMNLQSRPQDADLRLKSLELQRTAVESLLRAAPQVATQWKDALILLAANWLKEAEVTQRFDDRDRYGSQWQRDPYGNYYFMGNQTGASSYRFQNANTVRAIGTDDLLDARPRETWLALIDDDLKPKFAMTFSELHLKLGEDSEAFPYIEQLAVTHPEEAHELAEEFLRIWTRNHNPNESRQGQNPYMYYWGYQQRADRIPLTRSKQERNLKELGGWVRRMRALPIEDLDERLLANAFTTSHSKAEVYRLEAIEDVFGSIDNLKPRTLAELIQQMRGNLAGVWRLPDVQKKSGTNRKQRDIQAEVKRGYELARKVVRQALENHPEHWALVMADAAVMHDENDFDQELEDSSEFSERRRESLARYQRAAELYAAAIGDMTEEEQTTQVYEQWFYAGLGAVDLARVTAKKVSDDRQPARIREAITSLPGEAAERHLSKFANNLFTRIGDAKPELKYRYLKSGFEIVGDHKMAREARKLLAYYGDLVSEIKLQATIDGSDVVGHEQPFGVLVEILHTKEIERESGGFGRYLQNQNSNRYYYYNFGRPTQDYRDKFRDTVTQALGEQFDVISITFQDPEVNSKATGDYGWRVTPYAYLLLKVHGPEVDKIAPLRLDLDFLDTSGYAMLPIETPALPIDARSENPPVRPASELTLVQTLDERQASEGKLILEVRVKGRGLMPRLHDLVDFKIPGFEEVDVEGGDLSVAEFDKDAAETVIVSERTWLVTLRADDRAAPPETFRFAEAKLPLTEALYQRYEDADLVPVEAEIALGARYDRTDYTWLWLPLVAIAVVLAGGFAAIRALRGRRRIETARFLVPEHLTPFTVLGLLRDIQHNNGLDVAEQQELAASIDRLERHFFAAPQQQEPDLRDIAAAWVAKTSGTC